MNQRVVYLTGPETIELREEPVPMPGEGEILVRIRAATTCGTDVKVFRRGGHPRMLKVPTPFGHEFAGSVEEVGENVTAYVPGDRVVVSARTIPGREPQVAGATPLPFRRRLV